MSEINIHQFSHQVAASASPPHSQQNKQINKNATSESKNNLQSSDVCNVISTAARKIIEAFSPFLNLITMFNNSSNQNEDAKKITLKEVVGLLNSTQEQITKDKELVKTLSPNTKEALDRLYKKVSEFGKREDLQNSDISSLIQRWRQSQNSQELLAIASLLREGHCARFQNENLRQRFIRALESFGRALEEVENQNPTETRARTTQALCQAANPVVDAVERHEERGGDLNSCDRVFIRERLEESRDRTNDIVNDPEMSHALGTRVDDLMELSYELDDIIQEMKEREEEEEKEEEVRKEQEKLCEERDSQKKEIDKLHRRHKAAKRKRDYFYSLMEEAKSKIHTFFHMKELKRRKFLRKEEKYATDEYKKNGADFDYFKTRYEQESSRESYEHSLEHEIQAELSPSSACEHHEGISHIDLDLIC